MVRGFTSLLPLAETALASNTLPKALITTPGELNRFKPGVVVPFNGSESYDPDGGAITFYKWYVDGVLESSGGSPSYSMFHRSFTLASGERYRSVTITLEVRDDELSWSSVSRTFTITEVTTYYYITDHVGSIRSIVDDGGFEVSHEDFDPFGAPLPGRSHDSGLAYHQNKFTGHERDSEGDLDIDYMQSRTYDPDLGRFLSVDPMVYQANPLSLFNIHGGKHLWYSPYAYTFNNPVRFTDPTGLSPDDIVKERSNISQTISVTTSVTVENTVHTETRSVTVNFGTTGSDGLSGDQAVRADFKAAFELTIAEAAFDSDIRSITISATTNGIHGENSNHGYAVAADISMINGVPAGDPAVSVYANAIQRSFENRTGRNENFGPAMNMKRGEVETRSSIINQHTNHIHLSINR